jgi:hypothetical protein
MLFSLAFQNEQEKKGVNWYDTLCAEEQCKQELKKEDG